MLRFRSRQACPRLIDTQLKPYSNLANRRLWLYAQPFPLAGSARAPFDYPRPNLSLALPSNVLPGNFRSTSTSASASAQARRKTKGQAARIKKLEAEAEQEAKREKAKTSPEIVQAVFQEFKQWIAESQAERQKGSPLLKESLQDEQITAGESLLEEDKDGIIFENDDELPRSGIDDGPDSKAWGQPKKRRGLSNADMLRLKKELALLDQLTEDGNAATTAQTGTPARQAYFSRAEMDTLRAHLDTVADEAAPDEGAVQATKGHKGGKAEKTLLEQTLFIARHVLKEQDVSLGKPKQTKKKKELPEGDLSTLIAGVNLGQALAPAKIAPRDQAEPRERKKKRSKDAKTVAPVFSVSSDRLKLKPVNISWEGREPPRLSYNLDRTLFNPGVCHLQDPRSKVFNFDPYLAKIMPIEEFDFQALKSYVTSSKDNKLIRIAAEYNKKYCGSTSSMTSTLAHFHYLISNWRPIKFQNLSRGFSPESIRFTEISRAPTAAFLQLRDGGVYAIDSDKEFDNATVLSMLGKSMEKLLTLPRDDFEKYRRSRSHTLTEEEKNADEVYNYSTLGDFMMRSQLDAMDPRLPGSGIFDLKTRACLSVRMDAQDFMNRRDYEIRSRFGQYESFEREYFDLIRSAFMKYSLQVRMGRMDGIFVAYHNTQRIFGFQYIPLTEMDSTLHGTPNTELGDKEFMLSLQLLNDILNKITAKFHGRSIRLHVETRESQKNDAFMYVFAQPVTDEQVAAVQDANAQAVQEFEERMLGIHRKPPAEDAVESLEKMDDNEDIEEAADEDAEELGDEVDERLSAENEEAEEERENVWGEIMRQVEESIENEEQGVDYVRDAIRTALEQSGLLREHGAWPADDVDKYVDSLLDALTREDGMMQDASDSVEIEEDQPQVSSIEQTLAAGIPAAEAVEAGGGEAQPDHGAAPSEAADSEAETFGAYPDIDSPKEPWTPVDVLMAPDADDIPEEGEAATKASRQPTEDTDSGVTTEAAAPSAAGPIPTLKDLILKVTEKIDPNTYEEPLYEMEDAEKLEVSRLAEFQRLLSQLVAKSKVIDETMEGDGKSVGSSQAKESPMRKPDGAAEHGLPSLLGSIRTPLEPTIIPTGSELLGLTITVRNKQNGKYVQRVTLRGEDDEPLDWDLEYRIEEMEADRAARLYQHLLKRRYSIFGWDDDRSSGWTDNYGRRMLELSRSGRVYRREEDLKACKKPVHQWTESGGKTYNFTDFWEIPRKDWGPRKDGGGEEEEWKVKAKAKKGKKATKKEDKEKVKEGRGRKRSDLKNLRQAILSAVKGEKNAEDETCSGA